MIPYFQYNAIIIGPMAIQVWGLMVALGIVAAAVLAQRLAKKYFLSPEVIFDLTLWVLIPAFIFARLFHIVFYNLDYFLLNPWEVLAVWQGGASSFGGFAGAVLGFGFLLNAASSVGENFCPIATSRPSVSGSAGASGASGVFSFTTIRALCLIFGWR